MEQLFGLVQFLTVHGTDGVAAVPDCFAAQGQYLFPGGISGGEALPDAVAVFFQNYIQIIG
ncbi:hypothetical protein ACFLX7_04360 [Chloroflexota bacterium]